jgi:hypothetical protein
MVGNGPHWLSVLTPEGSGEPEFLDNCCDEGTAQMRASAEGDLETHPASWTTGWNGRIDGPASVYGLGLAD